MNTVTGPLQWLRSCLLAIALVTLTSCTGEGTTTAGGEGPAPANDAGLSGDSAAPTVPPTLFPGGEQQKPAALLTFTSDLRAISVTPDGAKLYVGDVLHNTVSAIDVGSRQVLRVIDVNTGPTYITVTPDGTRAFVANYGTRINAGNTVSVIRVADDRVIATVEVGLRPFALAATPDNSKVYVVNVDGNTVSVIDVKTLDVATIDDVGTEPVSIVVTHDGDKAFVANRGGNDVTVIDTATDAIIHTEPVQTKPTGLALLPDDSRLLVTNRDSNSVSVIDVETGRVRETLGVGEGPMAVAVSPDGKRAYVANAFGDREDDACLQDDADPANASEFGNTLSVIDLETNAVLPGQVEVGRAPLGIVVTGNGDKLYAFSACDPQVAKVGIDGISDAAAVVAEQIPVVARGTAITIDQDSSAVYVAHPHAVSVIDIATDRVVGAPIPARGAGPTRLAITSNGAKLYAIHPGTDSVSVFDAGADTKQLTAPLTVGSRPSDLALTPNDGQLLVANSGFSRTPDQRISVIDVATDVVETIPLIDPGFIDPDTDEPSVGRGPIDLAIVPPSTSSPGTTVFVAGFGDFFPNGRKPGKFISKISSDTTISSGTTGVDNYNDYGDWPVTVAVSDDVVYVADYFGNSVVRGQVSDPSAFTQFFLSAPIDGPIGIALDANDNAYVATYVTVNKDIGKPTDLTQIVLISPGKSAVVQLVRGASPNKIILAPDGDTAWILHAGDRSLRCGPANDSFCEIGNTVSVLRLSEMPLDPLKVPSLTVGKRPSDLAFANGKVYVSNYFDDTVSIIDASVFPPTVLKTIPVGRGPEGVVANPDGDRVYVANSTNNTISVIDVLTNTTMRPIEISP